MLPYGNSRRLNEYSHLSMFAFVYVYTFVVNVVNRYPPSVPIWEHLQILKIRAQKPYLSGLAFPFGNSFDFYVTADKNASIVIKYLTDMFLINAKSDV